MSESFPVTEHAVLHVRRGEEERFEAAMAQASTYISRQPGFGTLSVSRQVEDPSTYLLLVTWESVAAHEDGFRGSADYQHWRALLHHFYDPFPVVTHFVGIPGLAGPRRQVSE